MSPRTCFGWMAVALTFGTTMIAQASATAPVFLSVPPLTTIPQSAYVDIDGAKGGSLTVGRFTFRVAAGAYVGISRVTIFIPDPNVLKCNVTMNPVRTTFKTKPTLEANYSGATGTAKYFWWINYAPSTSKWVASSASTVSTSLTKVTEPLTVFAEHGVAVSKTSW